jgi:hypothetical protein
VSEGGGRRAALARHHSFAPRPARHAGHSVFPITFLATTRPDGSARLHLFCLVLAGGRLLAAIPRSSPKGNDLRREITGPWRGREGK